MGDTIGVATGSVPRTIPGFEVDGELYNIDTLKFFEVLIALAGLRPDCALLLDAQVQAAHGPLGEMVSATGRAVRSAEGAVEVSDLELASGPLSATVSNLAPAA